MTWFAVGLSLVGGFYPSVCQVLTSWQLWFRWLFHACYAVLAASALPLLSHDILSYMAEGEISRRFHQNPLTTPIVAISHWQLNYWLAHAGWIDKTSPYGPLFAGWTAVLGHFAQPFWPQFFWMKGLTLALVIATAYLIGRMAGKSAGLRFWLHPLVGLELLANGHNDVIVVFLMAAGYAAYRNRRWMLFAALWALAVATKFVPLAVVPMLLVGITVSAQVSIVLVGLFVVGACYAPYWHGWSTLLGPWSNQSLFLRSFDFMVLGILRHSGIAANALARHLAVLSGVLAFLTYSTSRMTRWLAQGADPMLIADVLLALALVGLSWFQYWYCVWALPFYVISQHSRARSLVQWLVWIEGARILAWVPHTTLAQREIGQVVVIWGSLAMLAYLPIRKSVPTNEEGWS
jgi:hypothetical protein